jgi:hypothetical protein
MTWENDENRFIGCVEAFSLIPKAKTAWKSREK